MAKDNWLLFQPRDYQTEFLEMAKEQNVIICLGTGSGKTYISIMLIKRVLQDKKKAIFLVPTVPLGVQQAESIMEHIGKTFSIRNYAGGLGPSTFDEPEKWQAEFDANDILVFTPDIFLQILSRNFIDIKQIAVLIFDECHHANLKRKTGSSKMLEPTNHAYRKIMTEVVVRNMHNQIRIVGLTASVVNNALDPLNLPMCTEYLEETFKAKVIGKFDLDSKFLAEPKIVTWEYEELHRLNEQLKRIFSIDSKLSQIIMAEEKKENEYFKNMLSILGFVKERSSLKASAIAKTIRDLGDVQEELGIYPAYLICKEFKQELKRSIEDFERFKQSDSHQNTYELAKTTIHFFEFFEKFYEDIIDHPSFSDREDAMFNLTSCKLLRILDIFYAFKVRSGHDPVSLIFVDRVFFSVAIAKYLQQLSHHTEFDYLNPQCFVGLNNEYRDYGFIRHIIKNAKQIIRDFKAKRLNVLVTTAVLEEGIDVGTCNLVIRFSDLQNNREFVQSKGRARARGSFYVILHDNKRKTDNLLNQFFQTEKFLSTRFQENEQMIKEHLQVHSASREHQVNGANDENFGGSLVYHNVAADFLQRNIRSIGKENKDYRLSDYVLSPEFEPPESEPCLAKLNLTDVTILENGVRRSLFPTEVKGKVHETREDVFRSVCWVAIRQLREMVGLKYEDEVFRISTNSAVYLNEAAAFLQRYIRKKGNNNYMASYEFEPAEEEPCVARLDLIGVTPLKEEVQGQVQEDRKLAFKSACLEAIRKLYEIGQLDDHFIPIGDEEIVKGFNLGSEEYGEPEIAELAFAFDRKPAEKLMFKKKINDQTYFEHFVKQSQAYDLYEIAFDSDEIAFDSNDERLEPDDHKLALLTTLDLSEEAFKVEIRNHFKQAIVKLVKQEVQLSADELDKVDEFTRSVFRLAVPSFAIVKPPNDQFDSRRCLFKFALIDQENSIDYDQMRQSPLEPNSESPDTHEGEQLVRTVYNDEQFKFVSSTTGMYSDNLYCESRSKKITYAEHYGQDPGIVIREQDEQLIKAERCYTPSVHREGARTPRHASDPVVYLPRELCVVSPMSELVKKVICLPRVIFEIKRTILLKHARNTWNHQILKTNEPASEAIFRRIPNSNIIDYIGEHFKEKPIANGRDAASSNSTGSSDEGSANECDESEDESEKMLVNRVNEQIEREIVAPEDRQKKKSKKKIGEIATKVNDFYQPMEPEALDRLQRESMESNLKKFGYPDLDAFLEECNFEQLFNRIVEDQIEPVDSPTTDSDAMQVNQTINQIPESNELKMDFNFFWTNESSDQEVISDELLREALIADEKNIDHERLEFLGDVFLKFVTCNLLFHLRPDDPVGTLDILRSAVVANKNLYMISRRNEISQLLFTDNFVPGLNWLPDGFTGQLSDWLPFEWKNGEQLLTLVDSEGFHRSELKAVDLCQFQRLKPKRLADGVESLIAAVLLSSGMRNAYLFMKNIGIYSDQFKIDLDTTQANWFTVDGEKYSPLTNDKLNSKSTFLALYKERFSKLEADIGYSFKDKSLLVQAFKHPTYTECREFASYESLEFLGDAVIDYLVARFIHYDGEGRTKLKAGQLSNLKQSLTNNNFFGTLTVKHGLDHYLIYRNKILFEQISRFKEHYKEVLSKNENGLMIASGYILAGEDVKHLDFDYSVEVPKVLGDVFEALMAAVFIDADFCLNTVWRVLCRFMSDELLKYRNNAPKTYLMYMHELYPRDEFENVRKEADGLIAIDINISIKIKGLLQSTLFTGKGPNKKSAKMDAARQVLKYHFSTANNLANNSANNLANNSAEESDVESDDQDDDYDDDYYDDEMDETSFDNESFDSLPSF